ncbi:SDR family NAD(P)-dependent oxidoreductase [Nonomuraea pusilla]|uniref:NAD(P)-dependent dehydrogenase, short-chain alcohol dehydrogenase family n=1 Tax=Nonomuraea pusilla TaxID=46177 RepID=A0A1H7ZJP0_9ACTN|nr:SDR family NAD(P)-dependent oxidoreductase [Nonomuraea pusilla]SEM58620.1 NAD(P)-dependent dehydrogenase, short-chain alcohol dehydrogenase family [Nonomuraea pusilla]
MKIALVTGAGRGVGREIARQLADLGMAVFAGVRDEGHAPEGTTPLLLDVTDGAAVANAAKTVDAAHGRLDVLVNNAAICGDHGVSPADVTADHMRATYEVGVFGLVAVTHAMIPLLRASDDARVVNLTTRLGSVALTSARDGINADWRMLAYNSAKSAVNALTVLYANELREAGIVVNAVDPGHCATDMTGHTGDRSAAEGAAVAVRMATAQAGGPTGTFTCEDGPLPW